MNQQVQYSLLRMQIRAHQICRCRLTKRQAVLNQLFQTILRSRLVRVVDPDSSMERTDQRLCD